MRYFKLLLMLIVCSSCVGTHIESNCDGSTPCGATVGAGALVEAEERQGVSVSRVRGTVAEPYNREMRDVVNVPAQVDPMNVYYRPQHQTIVEIIPGRVQRVQFPEN